MIEIKNIGKIDDYVYDISLDGTVVNALGGNYLHNTDGFNFKMPSPEALEGRHYVGKGLNRLTEEGKEYFGVEADLMEFNDLYLREKMGLDIDEYCDSTINFSRKNYADLLDNGKIKLVGNTIKSKKMPQYIETFLNKGISFLLRGKGFEFLQEYYDYIEKIYNLHIPLREIASKGKIKKSLEEYKADCQTFTAAGQKRSRQAWYELAIKSGLHVDVGDTVYFINTGKSKGQADIKRVTHYYRFDENGRVDITKEIDKAWAKYRKDCKAEGKTLEYKNKAEFIKAKYAYAKDEDEVLFNCVLLDRKIVESDADVFCDDELEYNVAKYIDAFNKRITPLLVCFHREIRDNILIKNPEDRKYFTQSQSELCSGEPYKMTDQDTIEEIMSMSSGEIEFWNNIGEDPVYAKDCDMNWEKIKTEYFEEKRKKQEGEIREEVTMYNEVINSMTADEINDFIDNGLIPSKLVDIIEIDTRSNDFISKKYKMVIGSIYDILEKKYPDKNSFDKSEVRFEEALEGVSGNADAKMDMELMIPLLKAEAEKGDESDSESSEE